MNLKEEIVLVLSSIKSIMKKRIKKLSDRDKILHGMDKVYEKLIESKKRTNSDLIVLRNNQIIRIKPE